MSLPERIDAYDDCFEVFQKALDDTHGTRVRFPDYGQAHIFMMRMHQFRALHRAELRRLYPPDDVRHGRSEFDRLMVRRPRRDTEDNWWIYIEHTRLQATAVESLSELEG